MYLSEVKKSQCTTRVVAYSVSEETNERVITFEVEVPRLIWSEVMTHRLFSRNAASSRAIPVSRMIEMVRDEPAMPVRFGANQVGMQDTGTTHQKSVIIEDQAFYSEMTPESAWKYASHSAADMAKSFEKAGYHKQVCNRLIEPFQYIKAVITFTGFGHNFFGLRNHKDADPTICEMAQSMYEAMLSATPKLLGVGDWHLPYYKSGVFRKGIDKGLEQAKRISASCCAQVSFRKLDDSSEKADRVFERLVESKPVHASPTEHQCTPLRKGAGFRSPYVTHIDRDGNAWSGNFRNWGQFRQVIEGNVIPDKI